MLQNGQVPSPAPCLTSYYDIFLTEFTLFLTKIPLIPLATTNQLTKYLSKLILLYMKKLLLALVAILSVALPGLAVLNGSHTFYVNIGTRNWSNVYVHFGNNGAYRAAIQGVKQSDGSYKFTSGTWDNLQFIRFADNNDLTRTEYNDWMVGEIKEDNDGPWKLREGYIYYLANSGNSITKSEKYVETVSYTYTLRLKQGNDSWKIHEYPMDKKDDGTWEYTVELTSCNVAVDEKNGTTINRHLVPTSITLGEESSMNADSNTTSDGYFFNPDSDNSGKYTFTFNLWGTERSGRWVDW